MQNSRIRLLFILITLICLDSFAQLQNNQWRIGYGSGIDFNFNPPTNTSFSATQTGEGSASVADPNTGALLFYTDGVTVWNSLNQVMPNGNGLLGGDPILLSSTTAAVIIPKPGVCTQYFIVTIDEQFGGNGLRYSLVDMLLNGGLGDIVPAQKNILLLNTDSEKIEVVPAQNGEDFWVITHDNPGNSFYSFLLNSSGFQTTPIVSTLGGTHGNGAGHLKVNQQFNKLACGSLFDGTMEVFSFNNSSGVVSSPITWNLNPIMLNFSPLIYGVEFSPNGNLLYISNLNSIVQYDISSSSPNVIESSAYIVSAPSFTSPASIQLGPNGKIYINSGSLDVINSPNSYGAACNFGTSTLIGGGYGLPKWVYSTINQTNPTISLNGDTCIGNSISFSISPTNGITAINWNFGDPNSGVNNTSSLFTPTHQFSDTGTYSIRCITTFACGIDTSFTNITTTDCTENTDFIEIVNFADSCIQNPILFSFNTNLLIENIIGWNFGDPNSGINNTSVLGAPSHTFSDTGTYTVSCIVQINCTEPPTPNNPIIAPCFYIDTVYTTINLVNCLTPFSCFAELIAPSDSCLKSNIQFSVQSDSVIISLNWNFGDPNTGAENSSSLVNPTHLFSDTGSYNITCFVTLSCGIDTIFNTIEIINCDNNSEECDVYIPNALTPNNDGINDYFSPSTACSFEMFEFSIFNRWGNEVYKTSNPLDKWDGKYKGSDCSDDVYFYVISYKSQSKPTKIASGKVSLLR
jgi:gliding motility-associated-like protein